MYHSKICCQIKMSLKKKEKYIGVQKSSRDDKKNALFE